MSSPYRTPEYRQRKKQNLETLYPFAKRVKRARKAITEIAEDDDQSRVDRIFEIRMLARDLILLEQKMVGECDMDELFELFAKR